MVTAKALATLDHLAGGGRVLLGVGVGWLAEEFAALGVPLRGSRPAHGRVRGRRARPVEPGAGLEGRFVRFRDVFCRPLPPGRRIPIIVGGDTPAAARRAGRIGDGYFSRALAVA